LDNTLSVQEAAEHFGVSDATIRRRIKAGELRAVKHAIPGGFEWRVYLPDQPVDQPPNSVGERAITPEHTREPHTSIASAILDQGAVNYDDQPLNSVGEGIINTSEALLKALELADRLQRENQMLAGQLGFVQAQLQAAQEQIRLLTVEKEPEEETPAAQPEPAQPSKARSPLWQWVRRRLSRT
jgi:excisionase family DNA binding protein